MRAALLPLAVAALPACGLGLVDEGAAGGGDHLPTSGAGPYGRVQGTLDTPASEPFIVSSRTESYTDAACLRRRDGGVRVWFGVGDAIGRAEVPSLHDLPDVGPAVAFAAAEAWEQGRVARPAIVEVDGGLVMFYEAGDPAAPRIGRADSADGGATWMRRGEVAPGGAPTAARVDGTWYLFAEEDGAIVRRAGDGLAFGSPREVVAPRPDLAGAFDADLVGDPHVVVRTSAAGRLHWGLWFTGVAGDAQAIGYAGSFDGERFERFGGADPVLTAPAAAPCVLLDGARGVMLYHEVHRQQQLAIGAAVHP